MNKTGTGAGFTLIEVLIAMTILALAAGVAFNVATAGLSRIERAHGEEDAVVVGQSVLARLGHDIPVKIGRIAGMDGQHKWEVVIDANLADPPPAQGLAAYPVHVFVQWREGRSPHMLQLDSVRLGPQPVDQ